MSEEEFYTEPPIEWIGESISFFVLFTFNAMILKKVLKKDSKTETKFTNKYFKFLAITSIASGSFVGLFGVLSNIPLFCTFSGFFSIIFLVIQSVFLTYYQIYRLYYCFSNDQIHSNYGYSKCLFIIMYTIGAILLIDSILLSIFLNTLNLKCLYNNYILNLYPITISLSYNQTSLWSNIHILIYLFWDILALILYINKIGRIKLICRHDNNGQVIYQRVLSILYKITILTLFYQLMIISFTTSYLLVSFYTSDEFNGYLQDVFFSTMLCSGSSMWTLSLYLMMDYNKDKYFKFLKFIFYSRLHFVCCCCSSMVNEQFKEIQLEIKEMHNNNDNNEDENERKIKKMKTIESQRTSISIKRITMQSNEEESVQTETMTPRY